MSSERERLCCVSATAALFVAAYGFSSSAQACDETQRLCVHYEVDFDDDDVEGGSGGSIHLDPLAPARGVRATIIRPAPEPPLGLYLDEEGCVDFPTQFAAGHRVLVYPSALLGPTKNIRISMFDKNMLPGTNPNNGTLVFGITEESVESTVGDVCTVGPVADDSEIHCDVPVSEVANIMAAATHTVHRLTSLPGNRLTGPSELRLVRVIEVPDVAFYDTDAAWLVLGSGVDRHKYLIAHEIGHWVESRTQVEEGGGTNWTFNYGYPNNNDVVVGPEPSCQFAVNYDAPQLGDDVLEAALKNKVELHGIRSAEYANAAMTEGFAHFVASVAFNTITSESGEFIYYKDIDLDAVPAYADIDYYDGSVDIPGGASAQTAGGWNGWVKNSCEDDWNVLFLDEAEENRVEISTEIDWLRYFWEFLTSQDVSLAPKPGFWDVVRILSQTDKHYPWVTVVNQNLEDRDGRVWENIVQTMTEDPDGLGLDDYLDRFETLNDTHWVWHDPT